MPVGAALVRDRRIAGVLLGLAALAAGLGQGGLDAWGGPLAFSLAGPLWLPLAVTLAAHALLADRAAGPAVAALALALGAADVRLAVGATAALAVVSLGPVGRARRAVAGLGVLALLAAGVFAAVLPEAPRVVVQQRLLGLWVGAAALILAGVIRRETPWQAALVSLALAGGLVRFGLPLTGDGLRALGAPVAWGLASLPWLALATGRPALVAALAPLGPALIGVLTGTAQGLAGAGLALAGIGLAAAISRATPAPGERPWPARLALAGALGLPGPGLAGATLALGAAHTAVGPLELDPAVGLCALGLLVGGLWCLWGGPAPKVAPPRVVFALLGLGLAVGGAGLGTAAALSARSEAAAEALSTPRLPPDDRGGHRRLWELEQAAQSRGRDAGP